MIRVGVIGCGGIVDAHVPAWRAVKSRARVTATCDVNQASAQKRAEQLEADNTYTNWRTMLADGEVDAVDVCLPHRFHRDAIVDAAEAGKHILTEKPLCKTVQEARDIEAAVKANGVILMCGHNQMFQPAPRTAARWIREDKIGRVFSLRTVDCGLHTNRQQSQNGENPWAWRGSAAEAGGGCAFDTGYHPAYMLITLANSQPTEVISFSSNYNQPLLDAEDTAQTMVRFENGAVGTIQTSWGHPWPDGHWQFHAIGEKGQIFGRGNDLYFQPLEGEPQKEPLEAEQGWGFVGEMRHFIDCIEQGQTPEQGLHEGITVLKLILGGYQSEREKRVIKL